MDNKKISVAIADDHTIFRDGLRRLLDMEEEIGVVGEAGNGADAVAMVLQHKPSILLLDLAMPKLAGLEVMRELAKYSVSARTILLTAAIPPSQVVEALECGVRGIVLKESATQVLLKAIHTVIAGLYWVGREPVNDVETYLREQHLAKIPNLSRSNFGLTRRENEILGTIVSGLSNKEIAQKFSLSEDTVKHHLTSIFDKVGVSSRLELALFAINNRMVESVERVES
jgi:two-component system, NarL family, nitrate/nitrite response regulator NarL